MARSPPFSLRRRPAMGATSTWLSPTRNGRQVRRGQSRANGDARLRRPSEASGSKPRRASLPHMKKGAFHEDHDTVTVTGGKRCSISNNYDWTEFYGMYLQAVNDKIVVEKQHAEAKEKNNELTSALAEAKKKNHRLKHSLAAAPSNWRMQKHFNVLVA